MGTILAAARFSESVQELMGGYKLSLACIHKRVDTWRHTPPDDTQRREARRRLTVLYEAARPACDCAVVDEPA